MEFLTYALSLVIAYSGLFLGLLLAWIAKEELHEGKKYFILLENILFVLIILLFIYFLKIILLFKIFLMILFLVFLIFITLKLKKSNKRIKNESIENLINEKLINENYAYVIFGFLPYFIVDNADGFFIVLSILLLYGLPVGTFIYQDKKQMFKKLLIKGLFVIISLSIYFLFQ